MNSLLKNSLLAGASAIAIISMSVSPSAAFDRVNWQWDATVSEEVTKTVNVNIDIAPVGMVMLEDLQVNIGDVSAKSEVSGVTNTQPQQNGDTVQLGHAAYQFHYGLDGTAIDDEFKSPKIVSALVGEESQAGTDINGTVLVTVDLGEVEVPPTERFDALTELPSIVSAATAVANNTNITSSTAVELHEGQFAFNTVGEPSGSVDVQGGVSSDNTNLTAANVLGVLALTGQLGVANIEATSKVSDILNASVDSSATAVANNMSLGVTPNAAGDSLVIADVVQFASANVTAKSTVQDITLQNYTNLGGIDRPIVNSVATAVGNNKSITVLAPVVAPVTQ
jgi:hypothetical protein